VLTRAVEIVASYEIGVTLRQLFYRLVSELLIPNRLYCYQRLSELTAVGRRDGTFPDLVDMTRRIHRPLAFTGPADARRWLRDVYRLDRTSGQPVSLYIGIEKHGLVGLLRNWFDALGIPILPAGGYASQSFVKEVREDIRRQDRPGRLVQVELDALPADVLRGLFQTAIDAEWDVSESQAVIALEARQRRRLSRGQSQ
jgi:hypothetical protein